MIRVKEQLKKRYIRFILLAVSGVVTGLTVCFPALGIFEWISMIPLFLVLLSFFEDEKRKTGSMYAYGLFYFMCYFVTCWHWFFAMYPMSYTGLNGISAFFVLLAAVLGLPFIQTLGYAIVFVLLFLLSRGRIAQRYPLLTAVYGGALFCVFEWLQTLFWFGVPWGRLAIGQTKILVTVQSASWLGCCFVTFLLVFVNFLLALTIYKSSLRQISSMVAAIVFTLNFLCGACMMMFETRAIVGKTNVAVIQGNISTADKWGDDWYERTVDAYEGLTREAAEKGAQIVVWPETVLPVYIETTPSAYSFITRLADECDIILMVGTVTAGDDDGQYNTIVTVFPDGSISDEYYYKQHLVPFGEFMPYYEIISKVFPAFEKLNVIGRDFTTGESHLVTDTGAGKAGSAICFDSIYDDTVRRTVKSGAQFIAIETNDSWFFDSAAVEMHKGQAVLRSVENRRYTVRAANTGISAIINEKGEVIGEVAALESGYFLSEIELYDSFSLYTIIGNTFVYLNLAFVCAAFGLELFLKIRKRRGQDGDK